MTRIIVAAALMLLLAACTTPPKSDPLVINDPVDAFDSVNQPYTPHNGQIGGGLGSDIQRLQEAHQLYQRSRERSRNRVERSQARCLKQSDSRRVPIKGAAAPGAVFCEPATK